MKRTLGLSLATILAVTLFSPALADDKPARLPVLEQDIERSLRQDYYGVYLLGNKVGFAALGLARKADPVRPSFVATMQFKAKIVSMAISSEMEMVESVEFDGKPPYSLLGGVYRQSDGKSTQETRLKRTAKGFQVTQLAGGEESQKQLPSIDYSLADELAASIWLRQGAKVGATFTNRSFEFTELNTEPVARKLLATKTSVADGVKVTFHEVAVTMPRTGLKGFERYDQAADRVLSMKVAEVFELRLEPERVAKNTRQTVDLFVLGTVKIDKSLGEPAALESLILEVQGKEGAVLQSGPRQTITAITPNRWLCKLGKGHGPAVQATAKEIAENLEDSTTYPIQNAKVRALAEEAVRGAKTPREKVERLVAFVSNFISASYTAQPLNIMELLKGKKGDCKAYSLLFTTLARAAGIPSRQVSGLLYIGDDEKTFGGHAWNEVVLDGVWVPVDASCAELEINPTHIRFGPAQAEGITVFLSTMGKLSFHLVEKKQRTP